MKFIMRRASDFSSVGDDYDQPIESAVLEQLEVTQVKTYTFPNDDWFSTGRNHRTANDVPGLPEQFVRDIDANYWTIELSSLDDLVGIMRREGRIIVEQEYGEPFPTLLIYDSYIE